MEVFIHKANASQRVLECVIVCFNITERLSTTISLKNTDLKNRRCSSWKEWPSRKQMKHSKGSFSLSSCYFLVSTSYLMLCNYTVEYNRFCQLKLRKITPINDQVPPNPEMQQLPAMTQKTQLVRTEVTLFH